MKNNADKVYLQEVAFLIAAKKKIPYIIENQTNYNQNNLANGIHQKKY